MQRQTCVWHRLFRVKCDKTENHSLPVAPEERQTTSLPRQRFARFAVFGFSSGLQHQGAAGLANSSLQRSLLMQRNSVSMTSVWQPELSVCQHKGSSQWCSWQLMRRGNVLRRKYSGTWVEGFPCLLDLFYMSNWKRAKRKLLERGGPFKSSLEGD